MKQAAAYLAMIREAYPALSIASATLNTYGQNNHVLIAWCDGGCTGAPSSYVFRFPRYPHVLAQLHVEAATLTALQGRLPLPIPTPGFVQLDGRAVGNAFVGYRMLQGAPLWPEIFSSIHSDVVFDRLAGQLGGFLRALHGFPATEIPAELSWMETHAALSEFYARIRDCLFPHMSAAACARVAARFERYLGDARHFTFTPVLRHGDFGTSNILYDTALQRITGVVDFGGIALGDPAYDVAGLLASYGEEFVARCAEVYPEIQKMMARVHFHHDTFALEEALFGLEYGDADAFHAGIAEYV